MKAKKFFKTLLCIFIAIIILIAAYVAYVFITYHRVEDNLDLKIENNCEMTAETGKEYTALSYNIGFGAYEPDYGFFMDGGTESWAFSKERLTTNIADIGNLIKEKNADICLLQEVDKDATRTYHFNELEALSEYLPEYSRAFAENWDSPFLFYPLTQPHGKTIAGIYTASKFGMTSSVRRTLPVEDSLMKIVDLDRCYSVSRINVENGKELVVYNTHLSAYTSDGTIATEQLKMLIADMQSEYDKGNYVICGGDFNKDLPGNSNEMFNADTLEATWAQPFPKELLDGTSLTLQIPLDEENPMPTCRNADGPYTDKQAVYIIDGFITSDNIEVKAAKVALEGFLYSDHNPVSMTFSLKDR